jgi:hypothetical protein
VIFYLVGNTNHYLSAIISLLSSRSVLDAPSFKGWEGIQPAREKLAEQLQYMIDQEMSDREGMLRVTSFIIVEWLTGCLPFLRIDVHPAPSTCRSATASSAIPN